jgi:hypothetical protein
MEFITSVELISNLKLQQLEKQEFSLQEQHGGWVGGSVKAQLDEMIDIL